MITQEDIEQLRIILERTIDKEMGKHTDLMQGVIESININVQEQTTLLEIIIERYVKRQEQINQLKEEIKELKKAIRS